MRKRVRRTPPALEWLDGALPGRMLIYVCGSSRVMVENHMGVEEFTPCRVRLAGVGGCLVIEGEALSLAQLRPGALIVCGRLSRLCLPPLTDGEASDK